MTQQKYITLLRVHQQIFSGRLTHLDLESSRRLGGLEWPLSILPSIQQLTMCLTLIKIVKSLQDYFPLL